jgi:hypothetical protein
MEYGGRVARRHGVRDMILLIVFWTYVSVPLAWGVYSTIKKAMALFR